jgi:shikimate dehydrogenase
MRLGVAGWPVAHSRSPAFQNAALAAVGLTGWRYQLLPIPPELFLETVPALPESGFRGINVTIPHKQQALALATEATARARAIGAANTLLFEPGGVIRADNTDAPALTAALPTAIRGGGALVLGAGGSARAAIWSLQDAGAAEVRVWNRNPARARELCEELGATPVTDIAPADVLINCTPVGLHGDDVGLEGLPVSPGALHDYGAVVDFVYRDGGPPLANAAREAGIPTVDGLELLVAQGALSFEQFTGLPAPLAAMRAAVGLAARAV